MKLNYNPDNFEALREAHSMLEHYYKEPDAYIFIDGITDCTHPTGYTLFGKPVFHIDWVVNPFTDVDCPYVPIWNTDNSMQQVWLSKYYRVVEEQT